MATIMVVHSFCYGHPWPEPGRKPVSRTEEKSDASGEILDEAMVSDFWSDVLQTLQALQV